jgi:hypothetical protein
MRGCNRLKLGILLLAFLTVEMPGRIALCAEASSASVREQPQRENQTAILNADFDGDSRPDVAIGRSHGLGYTIEIQFSTQPARIYLTLANGGIGTRIFAYDVDKDSFPDLVVTSATSLLPIAIYLSDGRGHFQEGISWSFLPFGLDSPYQFQSGKVQDSLVGLMPQTRFDIAGAPSHTMAPALETGDWALDQLERALAQRYASGSKPRSPPLSSAL